MSDAFGAVMDEAAREERRKALRALLQNPLITADGKLSEVFPLIRRHHAALNQWLVKNSGWSLYVDRETARLRKIPADLDDASRGAVGKTPFHRRLYALLCLALAALSQGEKQITLGTLFEHIVRLAAVDPQLGDAGLRPDPDRFEHRRDLVRTVEFLMAWGLLRRVDGDEAAYLKAQGDVLYTVNRSALTWLVQLRRSPTTIDSRDPEARLRAVTRDLQPETDEGRNRLHRFFFYRKLLDDPVLYYEDLDEGQRAYLNSQRAAITAEIADQTGLVPEVRREGLAMVDDRGELTDLDMPQEGTDGHIALLLADFLAHRLGPDPTPWVGLAEVEQRLAELRQEYGKYWRKDAARPEATRSLVEHALDRLAALSLVERGEDGVRPLPALARYRLEAPRIVGQLNLLEVES
jgi:uncharacterized protein (TIGR02678 family)